MADQNTSLPRRHLSTRVPWHDGGWDGTVCKEPKLNGSCLRLSRIAAGRDDAAEQAVAGQSIRELDEQDWPCCVPERAMFMAPFEYVRHAEHPYKKTSPETHGHFASTPLRHPPYSAPAVPFAWMFRDGMEYFAEEHGLDVDGEREPDLGFKTQWVQDFRNQTALLDCFFGHARPETSLCFFYAKEVPFVEDSRRVLVGVGRVKHVGDAIEYKYQANGGLRSILWERMIQHSIRPDFKDGFLLPYHAALDLGALEEVAGRLGVQLLDLARRPGMGREIQDEVAGDDLELAGFFADGHELAVKWDVVATGVLASDGDLEEVQAVGDRGQRVHEGARSTNHGREPFVQTLVHGGVERMARAEKLRIHVSILLQVVLVEGDLAVGRLRLPDAARRPRRFRRCSAPSQVLRRCQTSQRRPCRDCGRGPSPTVPRAVGHWGTTGISRFSGIEFPHMPGSSTFGEKWGRTAARV